MSTRTPLRLSLASQQAPGGGDASGLICISCNQHAAASGLLQPREAALPTAGVAAALRGGQKDLGWQPEKHAQGFRGGERRQVWAARCPFPPYQGSRLPPGNSPTSGWPQGAMNQVSVSPRRADSHIPQQGAGTEPSSRRRSGGPGFPGPRFCQQRHAPRSFCLRGLYSLQERGSGERLRDPQKSPSPWGVRGTQGPLSLVTQWGGRAGSELYTLWVPLYQCSPTSNETTRTNVSPASPGP